MTAKRDPVSKKTRFEVFKRDRFTCQYCGAKAPEVVLHCDHINPVAEGGDSGIMNLVTACAACNGGKGATKLDDRSAVERQRGQIEELQARREQLEMMLAWRDAEQDTAVDAVEAISDRIGQRGHFVPNEKGKADLRKWLRTYSLIELLEAMDISFDQYLSFEAGKPTIDSWGNAFRKIPAIASVRRREAEKPYLRKLFYIQGILRNRWRLPRENYVDMLEEMHVEDGAPLDWLERQAKSADDPQEIWKAIDQAQAAGRFN